MAGGINIAFASDTRAFLKGTKNVEDALGDVSDSLDDLSKDAQRSGKDAGDNLGDGFKDAGKDASTAVDKISDDVKDAAKDVEKSSEKMEKSFKDTFDSVKKDSKKAGDDVGDGVKKGFDKAEDSVGEFKDEANSTAKETAASFDGSAESITGAFQEVAANAFAGFGPAGAVAGLAAAAGIGMVTAAFEGAKEETEKVRERIDALKELFDEMGTENAALEEQTRTRIKDWAGDEILSGFSKNIAEAEKKLQGVGLTGGEIDTILRGMAGSPSDMAEASRIVNDTITEQKRLVEEAGGLWTDVGVPIADVGKIIEGNKTVQQQANKETAVQNRLLAGSAAELAAIKGGYDNIPRDLSTNIKIAVDLRDAEQKIRSWTPPMVTITPRVRPGYMNP